MQDPALLSEKFFGEIPRGGPTVTYLEISVPHPQRGRAAADRFFDGIEDALIDHLVINSDIGLNPHWQTLPGYKGNNLIARLLIVNTNIPPEKWVAMFPPEATVKVMVHPLTSLTHLFRTKLLEVDLPDDPVDRAEQEVLFYRMHRFRAP